MTDAELIAAVIPVIATYDNPVSYSRERWIDGRLEWAVSAKMLHAVPEYSLPIRFRASMIRIGPWSPGHIYGDPLAVPRGAATPGGTREVAP